MRRSERTKRKPEYLTFPDNRVSEDHTGSDDNESESSDVPYRKGKKLSANNTISNLNKQTKKKETVAKSSNIVVSLPKVESIMAMWKTNRVATINKLINICLRAAGCDDWVADDIDLEPLGPEEIDQLLEDRINEWAETCIHKSYPLIDKPKGKNEPFLEEFRTFWRTVTEEILSQSSARGGKTQNQPLRVLLEVLVCFSSIAVAAIRDSISTALLSVASTLIHRAIECKTHIAMLDRQISAFVSNGKQNRDETKSRGMKSQHNDLSKELAELTQNIDSLFHTVYMHRSRDSNEEVRLHSLQCLHSFLCFVPDHDGLLRSEYLKYLGWACNDPCGRIRVEAVRQLKKLLDDEALQAHEELQMFIASFMTRFIQMASSDVLDDVSLEMLRVLRIMQRQGHLDSVSEHDLDKVDALVFDAQLSIVVRVEALYFLFDHTEGFDEAEPVNDSDNEDMDTMPSAKNKQRKGTTSKNTSKRPQKHVALQVETLTEFVEHHLSSQGTMALQSGGKMLAEALVHSHKSYLMLDWTTLTALLMRESENLVSQALRPAQIHALLAMLVFSATHLKKRDDGNNAETRIRLEQLQDLLSRRLQELLLRFQDNNSNLTLLVELVSCLNPTTVREDEILHCLTILMNRPSENDSLLRGVTTALRDWTGAVQIRTPKSANAIGFRIAQTLTTQALQEGIQQLIVARKQLTNCSNSNGRRSSDPSKGTKQQQEALQSSCYLLKQTLSKLRIFSDSLNIFEHVPISQREQLTSLLSDAIAFGRQKKGTVTMVAIARDSLFIWLQEILWGFKVIMDRLRSDFQLDSASVLSAETEALIAQLLLRRNSLVEVCQSILDDISSLPTTDAGYSLGLDVFSILSALRSFFPLKTAEFAHLESLAFQPTDKLLTGMRSIFEKEEARLQNELERAADDNNIDDEDSDSYNDQTNAIAHQLATSLLLPLSRSLLFDVENMNKRQAAAVLRYINDSNPQLQEVAKQFGKKLKERGGLMRLAETFLTCLKMFFQEKILPVIKSQQQQSEDEDMDYTDLEQLQEAGYENLLSLAKRLSQQIVPVGRARGETRGCVMALCQAALDYALQDAEGQHVGFSGCLPPFVRLLGNDDVLLLKEHLLTSLQQNDRLSQCVEQERVAPSMAFARLFELAALLGDRAAPAVHTSNSTLRRKSGPSFHSTVPSVSPPPFRSTTVPSELMASRSNRRSSLMNIAEGNEGSSDEEDDGDVRYTVEKKTIRRSVLDQVKDDEEEEEEEEDLFQLTMTNRKSYSKRHSKQKFDYEKETDLMSPIVRRSVGKSQSFTSPALDLDIEDDEESIYESDKWTRKSKPLRGRVLSKPIAMDKHSQGHKRSLSDSIDDATLDTIPSSRRRFS